MPKGSEELTQARKDEIINACAELYETMSFRDMTLKDIGARTSFTRTLIYYYFHTKEEIFLALFQREYESWIDELTAMRRRSRRMTAEQFADALARSLERRSRLLKLMSMNLYDMETNSRMENLVAFKRVYGSSLEAVRGCLEQYFPKLTAEEIQRFLYAFFPFMFGIYPYTVVTDKQREAMDLAHIAYARLSIYEITRSMVMTLLRGAETEPGDCDFRQ